MKILFCLPGKMWSHAFLSGWNQTLLDCSKNNFNISVSIAYSASVYEARNSVLRGKTKLGPNQKPFEGETADFDYDFMMWIDSDVAFKSSQIFRLMKHDKDIVSGYYKMVSGKYPMIHDYNDNFLEKGWDFITVDEMEQRQKDKSGLFKVKFNGFGFMCIKKGVFESLRYPWFRANWMDLGHAADGTVIRNYVSEDISWCQDVIVKGYDIWVDPEVRVGHYKEFTI